MVNISDTREVFNAEADIFGSGEDNPETIVYWLFSTISAILKAQGNAI
jgi:hypothetical protein